MNKINNNSIELLKKVFVIENSHTAIITNEVKITYSELIHNACKLSLFFNKEGVRQGDRIAVNLPNGLDFIYCYFAAIVGGFTIVPINGSLPQREIDYIVNITKPKIFVTKESDLNFDEETKNIDILSSLDTIISIAFTSGTTSFPKGICHTTGKMISNALAFNRLAGIDSNVRMMHVLPMGYMAGFLNTILCPIIAGGTVIVAPQFSANTAMSFWSNAMRNDANAVWLTPTMASLLTKLNRDKHIPLWAEKNMRHIFVGTAHLPNAIKEAFEKEFHVQCFESYGMTEVMLVATNSKNNTIKDKSVGRLLTTDIKFQTRTNDTILPPGEEGELWIDTPYALSGYIDTKTGEIISPLVEGWFNTGDIGYLDGNDNLFITGRIKDLIIHGGTNISPIAIEDIILAFKGIKEVAVIGMPHPLWGEAVVAFIVLEKDIVFDESSLRFYCRNNLAIDAMPSKFHVLDELPKSSTGKVQKYKLKEMT